MKTNRNHTSHTLFTFEDGESFVESHRNSLGGWANAVRRVEQRVGGTVRPTDDSGRNWEAAGRRFTTEAVCKL